jgi:hypothetical protein
MQLIRAPRLTATVTIFGVASLGLLVGTAHGSGNHGFDFTAVATGLRATVKSATDPTGTQFDVSAPVSTAKVSSLPDSSAFAAIPYPGDDVISLANTVPGLVGVPAVPYPAVVRSGYPGVGKASFGLPAGYSISAESTISSSKASSQAGGISTSGVALGSSYSHAEVTGKVGVGGSAVGNTKTETVTAGPLALSQISSKASALLDKDGNLKLASSMQLGDITVAGQKVGLTSSGLTVAGTDIPLPYGDLTNALSSAGVTVTILKEQRTADSITAPGLLITFDQGGNVITLTLGRAQAQAVTSDDGTGAILADPVFPTGPTGSTAPTGGVTPQQPAVNGPAQVPTGTGTSVIPGSGPVGTNIQPPVVNSPDKPTAATPFSRASFRPETFSSGLFYLVLVLSALATLVLGQAMRHLGVRWAS